MEDVPFEKFDFNEIKDLADRINRSHLHFDDEDRLICPRCETTCAAAVADTPDDPIHEYYGFLCPNPDCECWVPLLRRPRQEDQDNGDNRN